MPALYAHLRFGEEVAKHLPMPYAEWINRFPEAFALGTQGPDILCYYKPLKSPPIRKRAPYLHSFSGKRFFLLHGEKLRKVTPTCDLDQLFAADGAFAAYTCGVLCHFTLDAECHLYIDENSTDELSHGKIESEFDKYLLRHDGKPIRGYNTATPIWDKNGTVSASAKTMDVDEACIARCIKTMRKINGMFSKKCEAFHALAHIVLKMLGMERQFGDMFIHKKDDPLCASHNLVLMEKWKNAIPTGAAIIPQYFENLTTWLENQTIDHELFRYDFSGIIKEE